MNLVVSYVLSLVIPVTFLPVVVVVVAVDIVLNIYLAFGIFVLIVFVDFYFLL